ncbi:chemotaxis protein CheW [Coprothermobacter platensis]|uniref:chemotaxis protein CheW n=1 Tax=Coprothermobacter platensis TaxID=108819 RepID=UPI00037434CB|nr:chemotaxis protein CheW [Coprothermobacter platensis]
MRYITYELGDRVFASELLSIKEIVLKQELRPIPGSQEWLLGVMALRGQLLPVVDLGLRLQGKSSEGDKILVMDGERLVGFLVDDVKTIEDVADLKPLPAELPENVRRFLTGSFLQNDSIVLVLDLSKVLSEQELSQVTVP